MGQSFRVGKPFRVQGKAGWWIRYTDESGRRRKKSFAAHEDAQKELTAAKTRVAEVKDGKRAPPAADRGYGELADYWISYRASQKRSGHHDESIIRAHLRPFFSRYLVREIGVAETDRYQLEKSTLPNGKRPPLDKKTVHNHLTLLIAQLNLAMELGWISRVPRIKKPSIRPFDADYSYLRTTDEIRRFLIAAQDEGELAYTLYATAVYTGMRAGELAALTWDDVDFEKRLVTVQRSFDGPTKAGDVRYVPLLDVLFERLREWRLRCPGRLLFPNRDGRMQCESARIFQEIFHRVLEAAGWPRATSSARKRWYIVFHDLRHTFASHWVMNGGDIFKLQKILGHKDVKMTMRYAHLAPAAFAGDHGRLGAELPSVGDVVPHPLAATLCNSGPAKLQSSFAEPARASRHDPEAPTAPAAVT